MNVSQVSKMPVVMRNKSYRVDELEDWEQKRPTSPCKVTIPTATSTPCNVRIPENTRMLDAVPDSKPSQCLTKSHSEQDVANNEQVKVKVEEDKPCPQHQSVGKKNAFDFHEWTRSDTFDMVDDQAPKPPVKPTRNLLKQPKQGDEEREKQEKYRKRLSSFCR